MCGRFTLRHSASAIAAAFNIADTPTWEPRYNIAPTQQVLTILPTAENQRQFQLLRWGLIPAWAKDPAIANRLINARAETVAEKPSFRSAFRQRRCLIVADGFYEWQRQNRQKQPFYFRLQNDQPFAFAGLWERWQDVDQNLISSCTIITTAANQVLAPIHDRMPVILESQDYDLWLKPSVQQPELLQQLLCPYPAEEMMSYPVSTKVNNPTHNSPEFINSL